MDNASKALIIAGAILIAVMLVSLGVMLYNTAAGVAESTTGSVEALGVEGFNAQFETYLGTNKSKAQAASLVSKVLANNSYNDTTITVNMDGTDQTSALGDLRNTINSKKDTRYTITATYDSLGTINVINITSTSRKS